MFLSQSTGVGKDNGQNVCQGAQVVLMYVNVFYMKMGRSKGGYPCIPVHVGLFETPIPEEWMYLCFYLTWWRIEGLLKHQLSLLSHTDQQPGNKRLTSAHRRSINHPRASFNRSDKEQDGWWDISSYLMVIYKPLVWLSPSPDRSLNISYDFFFFFPLLVILEEFS